LADFGLARADDMSSLPGGVAGTAHYMSPEQCQGEPLDQRSDLYALGATYYALLVGRPPYAGSTLCAILYAHCSQPIPNARAANPQVPATCAAIAGRALAKYAAQRYGSAADMLAVLAQAA
jgi:urea transport system substrate-binding protein